MILVGRLADGLMPSSESDQPLCARSTHMAFRPHDRAPVMSKGFLCPDEQCLQCYDFILQFLPAHEPAIV